MPPLWLIKVVLIAAVTGNLAFVREYWADTRGGWMHDQIGITLMLKDLCLLAILSLVVLSVFFELSRFTSDVIAWIQDIMLASVAVIFFWRTWIFRRERDRTD